MEGILSQFRQLGEMHSYAGFVASAIFFGLRLYRLPVLQARIPARLRWSALTVEWQWVVTLCLSALGGGMTALATGKSGIDILKAVFDALQQAMLGGLPT